MIISRQYLRFADRIGFHIGLPYKRGRFSLFRGSLSEASHGEVSLLSSSCPAYIRREVPFPELSPPARLSEDTGEEGSPPHVL